ncbi:MAG: hypothetical protein OES13_00405 [Acidimicrobiia bacterium]|nr:hypothetical protein [Acidimicrobiia bacterium]
MSTGDRRFQITVDVPGDPNEPPACRSMREIPVADVEDDNSRLDSWLPDTRIALGKIERATVDMYPNLPGQAIAGQLVQDYPWIKVWAYHHFNFPKSEELVRGLRSLGCVVIRVLDMMDVRENSGTLPLGNWNRVRHDAIERFDVGVRAPWGRHIHFSSFGRGRILKWDDITGAAAEYLREGQGFFDEPAQLGNFWWFDQRRDGLTEWMVAESQANFDRGLWEPQAPDEFPLTQEHLDDMVVQDAYGANNEAWMMSFLERVDGQGFVNGDQVAGIAAQFSEAHNTRKLNPLDIAAREAHWQATPHDVLEIITPGEENAEVVWQTASRVLNTWSAEGGGGMLWCDGEWYPGHPSYPNGAITPLMESQRNALMLDTGT